MNDVSLQTIDTASVGFLNNSYQQFDYGDSITWSFQLGGANPYAGMFHILSRGT